MTKGTYARGKKRSKGRLHIRCRRCGQPAYHKINGVCARCGYGKSRRLRHYNWNKKHVSKRRILHSK